MTIYTKTLTQIISDFSEPAEAVTWVKSDVLEYCFADVLASFEHDYQEMQLRLSFMSDSDLDLDEKRRMSKLLVQDIEAKTFTASTTSLLAVALDKVGIVDRSLVTLVLASGLLSDIPHGLPYHGTRHFRKVVFHMFRFIMAFDHVEHTEIDHLTEKQKALLLCAAAIHDLGHDGGGNVREGLYQAAYLEIKSFGFARPFLLPYGGSDSFFRDLEVLLFSTDASPSAKGNSPADQLRLLYMYHYMSDVVVPFENLYKPLMRLKKDASVTLLCVLLHEADIFNSAAVDYSVTIEEAKSVFKEMGSDDVKPSNCLDFLEGICHARLYSSVARYLGQDVFDVIMACVREDVANGDRFSS